MSYVWATLVILGFMGLAQLTKLATVGRRVIAQSREALVTIGDPKLTEDDKEVALRRLALSLFRAFFLIVLLTLIAAGVPLLALYLAGWVGLLSFGEVLSSLADPIFLIVVSLIFLAAIGLRLSR